MSNRTFALALAAIAALTYIGYRYTAKPPQSETQTVRAERPATPKPPTVKQHNVEIHDGTLTVEAGKAWTAKITVPPEAQQPRLEGRFEAYGGNKDDVNLLVFLPDEFTNWSAGNQARAVFQTGRKKVSDVATNLEPGSKYTVAVSNRHAMFFSRNVSLKLTLRYQTTE